MATKVVTGKVRFSYVNVFHPQQRNADEDPKYSVTLLIPKSDEATVKKILEAITEAAAQFRAKNGASSLPAKPTTTLHDGDGIRDGGDPYGSECRGCYVMTVSSKRKPVIVDAFRNEIIDEEEVYSGCYGRASINFYGYNSHGKKGISAGLLSLQKLGDGEPLSMMGSADDFDDDFRDNTQEQVDDFLS